MRKIFSLFAAMLIALVANAAVVQINNSTADALRLALNNAATGDIIEMAAGTYVESNSNYIAFTGKEVTVRAAEGAEVIIQPQVSITISGGALAKFENIKIDASRLVELADWYEHLIYAADDAANNRLVLEGCELYGFSLNKSMIYCNATNKLAAVTIKNCYLHNIEKSVLFVENTTDAMNVQVTNSTFANIIASNTSSYYAGTIDVRASSSQLLVDHCTFYNVKPMNTDYSAVSKVTLTNGAVSNCIFMLPAAEDGFRAMRGVKATNCITFNYLKDSGTGIHSSVTKDNCVQVDPLFVDAANGDFHLGTGSPALTMNDGAPIGDPRWAAAPAPAHTYTVAGSSEAAFGTAWAPTNEANDMALVEGLYKWEKTDLTLPAGTIEFKVCEDHAWTVAYPSENYSLAIAEAGIYTITITYNPEGNVVNAVATKTGSAVVISTVAMHGNFLGSWADTENFTVAAGDATASLKLTLAVGNYEFGMRIGGSGNWTSNGVAFTRENASAVVEAGSGNLTLAADAEGEYTFTWTYETNTLAITFPEKQEEPKETVIYNWSTGADAVGTTILGGNSNISVSNVKIHTNTDQVDALKFGSSFVYTDGKWVAIKPAEGTFKAGDVLSVAVVFNNSDNTKYCMVDLRAADGDTRIWMSDSLSTINGRTNAGDPIVQTYTLAADADSLFIGRYGNTAMCVTLLKVVRPEGVVPPADPTVAIKGSMNGWTDELPFVLAGDKQSASLTANIKKGDYEFKMIINGEWRSNGYTYHRDFVGAAGISGNNEANMVIQVDVDGDYTFTWTFANDSLGIVFPEKQEPQGCKWDEIEFFNTGLAPEDENYNQFKICKTGEQPNVVNIQTAPWADNNKGIYINFPSANFGAVSLAEGQYKQDGAGFLLYLSAFTALETEVTIVWDNNPVIFTVYNAKGGVAPVEHTYTVAGGSEAAFGTAWDPANATNDMVKQEDGTYKWEKTELTLPAGAIEFKVCEDHAWTVAYPAQNYSLAIDEAGIYTITITFNPADENKVAAVATKTGSAVVIPTVAMHGNFLGTWADTENFTIADGNETASLKLTLAVGNYEFGMRIGGSGNWTANGVAFTRENASAVVEAGSGNLTLDADAAGEYVFTWTYASNTLAITFPAGTGIDNTADGIKAVKVLRDGQILIIKGDKTFNMQGQIVK